MEKADFKEYTHEELIDIAYNLSKDCERLRKEIDDNTKTIR